MSEPRTDPPRPKPPQPADAEKVRRAPSTDTEIPVPKFDDDNILGADVAPNDDSPTIISKNPPKHHPPVDDGIRGRKLAHFELLEQIGSGGMAAVLRARDTQLDRIVALKILPPDMAADADNVLRFSQEARSAAKLDHENIARVFFCGEDQRLHFIAFEFVEGENLRTILDRRGRLPVAEALPYILQVAAGLAHAAERGVVHRDIKPSNIIITPAGRAKLVDMGLARSLGPQKDLGLTHSGVTLGTFDYISPEQALEPRDADVRSDIYSLGCTFYHMVTGRAPVPEGTAAKKLHCHQHVPPTDPRELVAGLPDEIALILDRMMAKDPRARYQSAGELVQHLLTAAKHLRVGADVPEGVLFVEAPLPRSSVGLPYVLVGLAVAAVVALIMFLEQPSSPPGRHPADNQNAGAERDKNGKTEQPGGAEKEKNIPPKKDINPKRPDEAPAAQFSYDETKTPQDLLDWLALDENKNARHIELSLARDLEFEIRDGSKPLELVVSAQKVTVRPAEGARRPSIRLIYNGGLVAQERAALRLKGKKTEVRDVQFVLDARGADVPLVGLALEGESNQVQGCDFVQVMPYFGKDKRLTSLSVARGKAVGPVPQLDLTGCTFVGLKGGPSREIGGQDAVARHGPARIVARDCAFGPHQTTFRLDGGKDDALELEHCSVMAADQSAVFSLLSGASVSLTVGHSLFSRPGGYGPVVETEPAGAVLVRLASDKDRVTYVGKDNRFHNLTGLLGVEKETVVNLPDFLKNPAVRGRDEQSAFVRGVSPWENDRAIEKPGDDLVARAFAPKKNLADLRPADARDTSLIGVEALAGKSLTEDLPPVLVRPTELTVNPAVPTDNTRGMYRTLDEAVTAVKTEPGDKTILIQHDGDVVVKEVIRLSAGEMNLTIRAAPGSHPVLTLGQGKVAERDAALFRLHDGQLHLIDVAVRLRPVQPATPQTGKSSQAVVALMGEGLCSFENCVVTLDQNNQTTTLALATLPDTGNVMKMDMKSEPATPRVEGKPRLVFKNCFVHGTGDLVWNQTGRHFDLEATHLLAAVSGSVCNVEVGGKVDLTQTSVLELKHTTTFLGGPLLRVRGEAVNNAEKLPAYQVTAGECLFLPEKPGTALVLFDTKDTDPDNLEMKLKMRFTWEKDKTNAFGNFEPLFLAHKYMEELPQSVLDLAGWQKLTGTQGRFRASTPAVRDTPFQGLRPAQLPALHTADQPDLGADAVALEKLLPPAAPR